MTPDQRPVRLVIRRRWRKPRIIHLSTPITRGGRICFGFDGPVAIEDTTPGFRWRLFDAVLDAGLHDREAAR